MNLHLTHLTFKVSLHEGNFFKYVGTQQKNEYFALLEFHKPKHLLATITHARSFYKTSSFFLNLFIYGGG